MSSHHAIPEWDERVPESSLGYRVAPIADPWRYDFDCGTGPFAEEVREAISKRVWKDWPDPKPRLLQFGTEDAVVAHLLVGVVPLPHPTRRSRNRRHYVALDYFEVAKDFQKQPDGRPGETFASAIMRHVEQDLLPRFRSGIRRKRPIGLYAIVRVGNTNSIRLLDRLGFVEDADNPFDDGETGQPSLLYRKVLWE